MNLKLLAAAVILAALSATHWKAYDIGKTAIRAEWKEASAAAAESARLKERSWNKTLEEARNAATKREAQLRADAGRARDAADGLRGDLAELRRRLPELAANACRQRADTLADVLQQCADAYRGMAETSDRLNSDRQTLMDAWPK